MELRLIRVMFTERLTSGRLFIDGRFFGYAVEDVVRERDVDGDGDIDARDVEEFKIPKETAIPAGRYRIILENSPNFGPSTMTVTDVPGYKYIRIHPGNTELDTEGCILVGYQKNPDGTLVGGTSGPAVKAMVQRVQYALALGDPIWLVIENERK